MGATGLPNGAEEKLPLGRQREPPFFYKERLGTESPLIRPSVRTGAPSQGEGFGEVGGHGGRGTITGPMSIPLIWNLSFTKMLSSIFFLENASQIGLSIPEEIEPRTGQRQPSPNPASGNERPEKTRVQGGALPPWCFLRLSSKESCPCPGPGGQRGAAPQGGFWRHSPEGTQSTGLPLVGGPGLDQRRSRPATWVPARSRGIQAFSRESPDAKSRGEGPRPPFLWAARSHSLVLAIVVPDPFEELFPPKS